VKMSGIYSSTRRHFGQTYNVTTRNGRIFW
jgi:hypothetical protein